MPWSQDILDSSSISAHRRSVSLHVSEVLDGGSLAATAASMMVPITRKGTRRDGNQGEPAAVALSAVLATIQR